ETARRVMRSATDLGSPDIDQVLLVGGSTRMPMVRSLLEEQLTLPVRIADPDKAVARGAALLADELVTRSAAPASNASRFAEPRITSVLPRSLGVLTWSSADPVRDEPYVQHVLRANTPLPIVEAEHVVATIVDDQDRARIQIYEQAGTRESSAPADKRLLLEGESLGIPPGPAGSPIRLRLSASVDGRISVESMDGARPLRLEIEAFLHGVLDDEEVAAQRTAVAGLKVM